jgi:hypothetical protein
VAGGRETVDADSESASAAVPLLLTHARTRQQQDSGTGRAEKCSFVCALRPSPPTPIQGSSSAHRVAAACDDEASASPHFFSCLPNPLQMIMQPSALATTALHVRLLAGHSSCGGPAAARSSGALSLQTRQREASRRPWP